MSHSVGKCKPMHLTKYCCLQLNYDGHGAINMTYEKKLTQPDQCVRVDLKKKRKAGHYWQE